MGSIVLKTVILNKYLASLVAFFIYLTFLNKPVGGDEGLFLLQARMLQDGILPVVDYYSKDVPYFLYLYSIIMDIFGSTFVIARVSTYLVGVIGLLFVYEIVRYLADSNRAGMMAFLLVFTSQLYLYESSPLEAAGHSQTAIVFFLASLYFFIKLFESTNKKHEVINTVLSVSFAIFSIWTRLPFVFPAVVLFVFFLFRLYKKRFVLNSVYIILILLLSTFIASFGGLYIFKLSPENFIFSYTKASEFFSGGEWYAMFGDYNKSPWGFRWNVLVDYLLTFRGQTAILSVLVLYGIIYEISSPEKDVNKRLIYWVVVLSCVSYISVYVFISSHGFTWHYFGSAVPLFAIIIVPLYKIAIQQKKSSNLARYFIVILILYSLLFGFAKMAKNIYGNLFHPIESRVSVSVLNELANELHKYVNKHDDYFVDNPYIYFVNESYPDLFFVNTSWLHQIFKAIDQNSFNEADAKKRHLPTEKSFLNKISKKEFKVFVTNEDFSKFYSKNIMQSLMMNYHLHQEYKSYSIYIPR